MPGRVIRKKIQIFRFYKKTSFCVQWNWTYHHCYLPRLRTSVYWTGNSIYYLLQYLLFPKMVIFPHIKTAGIWHFVAFAWNEECDRSINSIFLSEKERKKVSIWIQQYNQGTLSSTHINWYHTDRVILGSSSPEDHTGNYN